MPEDASGYTYVDGEGNRRTIQSALVDPDERGYGERTSAFSSTAVFPSADDIPGCVATVAAVGSRPLVITFGAAIYNTTAGARTDLVLLEDGVKIARAYFKSPGASDSLPVTRQIRRNPAAGSHTYKLALGCSAGSGNILADNYADIGPAAIRVEQG